MISCHTPRDETDLKVASLISLELVTVHYKLEDPTTKGMRIIILLR